MASIPNEIWTLCWDIVTRDDLKSLSCVCRLFRLICQPLLFNKFTFPIPFGHNPTRSNDEKMIKKKAAVQGVVSTPLLVESVQRVSISVFYLEGGGHLLPDEGLVDLFSVDILKYLPRFSNTKTLILEWDDLSRDFLDSILAVANQYLRLEELRLPVNNVPPRTLNQFSSLKVLALGSPTVGYNPPPSSPILIPASIKELFARSMTTPRLLLGLLEDDKHHNLTSFDLYLDRRFLPIFFQCLPLCPQLKYLVIEVPSGTTCLTPPQLPETSVPNLERFTGPLELASIIVPNRPIRRLCIVKVPWKTSTDSMVLHDMSQLARSTGPVVELSFSLHIGQCATLPLIAKLFPTLLLLNVTFRDDDITPDLTPEKGIFMNGCRLQVKEPWRDTDSLENHSAPNESSGYKVLVGSTVKFTAGVDILNSSLF